MFRQSKIKCRLLNTLYGVCQAYLVVPVRVSTVMQYLLYSSKTGGYWNRVNIGKSLTKLNRWPVTLSQWVLLMGNQITYIILWLLVMINGQCNQWPKLFLAHWFHMNTLIAPQCHRLFIKMSYGIRIHYLLITHCLLNDCTYFIVLLIFLY